jgi:transposase
MAGQGQQPEASRTAASSNGRWSQVAMSLGPPTSRPLHVARYFVDGRQPKAFLAAAGGWMLVIPWPRAPIIALCAAAAGFLFRHWQVRRARRRLGVSGASLTFRASHSEIDRLPIDRPPLVSTTRECVCVPVGDRIEVSAVADGRRSLTCTLRLPAWSMHVQVDARGRVQTITLKEGDETVLERPALGRVPDFTPL